MAEVFKPLREQAGADARAKFAALAEIGRAEAVLLSLKAQVVVSVVEDVARRKIAEEKVLGVSSGEAKSMLAFAENMTEHYPALGRGWPRGR